MTQEVTTDKSAQATDFVLGEDSVVIAEEQLTDSEPTDLEKHIQGLELTILHLEEQIEGLEETQEEQVAELKATHQKEVDALKALVADLQTQITEFGKTNRDIKSRLKKTGERNQVLEKEIREKDTEIKLVMTTAEKLRENIETRLKDLRERARMAIELLNEAPEETLTRKEDTVTPTGTKVLLCVPNNKIGQDEIKKLKEELPGITFQICVVSKTTAQLPQADLYVTHKTLDRHSVTNHLKKLKPKATFIHYENKHQIISAIIAKTR
ncbi:MAG: hypothetical protein A3F15_02140 [Candidatus Wildermuthbacteria bacterium RIFCSPHIGHO2_12_FULL_40_12]|uniref:Uncharacterized protein n=1 Tax=Candidatus Wildermuthbacteria bacterium RIFCSPHIGHO2_12_FULL_40_12 TaxID=1802457 RepID=A0A1G2RFU7_9BACT|nr:MAG: hypothetical protein A3F15_02140 [Candidatus Wildermuthbacteria bacterium RIFCSPHIGHO2_12_FULL_40_12]